MNVPCTSIVDVAVGTAAWVRVPVTTRTTYDTSVDGDLDWEDVTELVPAMVTAITMPLTFSIAHGIGIGFIAYAGIKLLAGRAVSVKNIRAFGCAIKKVS